MDILILILLQLLTAATHGFTQTMPVTKKIVQRLRYSNGAGISLGIVFDSTGSMGNDLKQVKLGCRRILRKHLKRGYQNLIKDFVLVQVHDPDVGPAKKTKSAKVFNRYLDSVYTQGGGDCPEMTVSGIEMAITAARPNSLIYVFTDSSAKDYKIVPRVLRLIQKKQSQVVFVLTGFCNSTDEEGFRAYKQIATISSGQVFLIKKGDVKEFMKVVETAVEFLKVHLLQEDTTVKGSKTYSFPVDSHLSQITIQVSNDNPDEPVLVTLRDPNGRKMTEKTGLERLLKNVKSVYFASKERPSPGIWTLEVVTKSSKHSIRVTGASEVDFLPGFSPIPSKNNVRTSRQPIKNIQNYLMANISGNFDPGAMTTMYIMSVNGTTIARLPLIKNSSLSVYISRYPYKFLGDSLFYIKISGKDHQGFAIQRYSKVAVVPREPDPVLVSCPPKIEIKRGSSVKITCLVQSEIPYNVKWYKDDSELSDAYGTKDIQFKRDTNVTYTISKANEGSQGVYTCEMVPILLKKVNIKGDKKDQVVVTVLPPPPKVFVPRNASVEPLKDAVLECNVFSTSTKVKLKWFKDVPRFEIKNTKKFQMEYGQKSPNVFMSKLTIVSASESDKGKYICVAQHEGGQNEAEGFVNIHTLPVIVSDNKEISFSDGKTITATCRSDGIPPPKINWFLNNKLLNPKDPRVSIVSNLYESEITISRANPSDSGRLSCKAKNSAGESEVEMKILYTSTPKINSVDVAKDMAVEGEEQSIRCTADGIPPPTINWEFNGSPVSSDGNMIINETTGLLKILQIKNYMKGLWSCVATNNAGTDRKSFMLNIGAVPKITDFNTNIQANYGEEITLKCKVEGQPPPKVTWFKGIPEGDFIPIAIGNRYFLKGDNSLLIKGIKMEDQTIYKCIAQNSHGKTEKIVKVDLSGITSPKIAFSQSKQIAVEGNTKKVITCLVLEAKPPPKISWLKNGKEIESTNRVIISENKVTIRNVKTEDEGIYTCIAKNQVGTAQFDIDLDVQTKPLIVGDQKEFIDISEGKRLELQCVTKGDPKPKIEWRKGGSPLTMQAGSTFIFSQDGSKLTIYSAVEENAGTYTCTAVNDHSAVVKEFKVTVKTPPIISKQGMSDYEIGVNDVVELNCIITNGNPNPKIKWFKDGQSLVEIPGRVQLSRGNNVLKLFGKNEAETGSYECRASNDIGADSRFYQITVLVPPKASESKLVKIYTREGEQVILPCKIKGYPPPKKTWSWKSTVIDFENNPLGITRGNKVGNVDDDSLTIMQMRSELQGIYVCEAVNAGGRAKMMYDVIILESPKIVQFKEHSVFFIGNTITLTCVASGNPSPKIKWLFQGKVIPPNSPGYRVVGKNAETLIVDRAASKHGGKYGCLAENEGGSDQKDAIVTVFVPSTNKNGEMTKNLTSTQIVDGGNITFTCVMNSTPPAEIKWFKNNVDIFKSLPRDRFHISSDGSTLTLLKVSSNDEGKYKCIAINIPGQWSMNFTLQVIISPVILGKRSSKKIMKANEEADIFIRCWAEGNPPPKYYWYRDNSEIISGGRIDIKDGGKTLQISNARRSDSALYTCKVKNEAGEDKREFKVNVYVPPSIAGDSTRETPEFIKGKSANLWCNVTGYPTPKIQWEYNTLSNPPILLNSTQLHFLNVQKEHITRYTCSAINEAGNARKVFDPILIYPPTIKPKDSNNKRWLLSGGEIRLSCTSDAVPRAKVEWLKNGETINYHPRINITNDGTLLSLFNVQESDVGAYKCIVSNKLGKDKQSWTIDIMVPPNIKYFALAGKRQVALGGTLYLFCVPEGRPKPKLIWLKDGSKVDPTRVNLSPDGFHLTINATEEQDVGRYQCVAENKHGRAEKSYDVEITYGPTLDSGGKKYYKIERTVGGTVVLECLVSGNPDPQIIWYKDGIPIQRLPSFRYRLIGNKRQLEIIAMQGDDAGRYSCVAKNTFGQMEIFMDVSVGAPPNIVRSRIRKEYIVKVGDDLTLPCVSKGSPKATLTFYKDGVELSGGDPNTISNTLQNRITISQERQTLTVFTTKTSDSGLYQCNASNPIGYDLLDYIVKVRSPPRFDTSNIQTEAHWYVNQTRSLECTLLGVADPPAEVTWERHGSPLISGGNIKVSSNGRTVTVTNVQQFDAGDYRCFAKNDVGKISLSFLVLVYVEPKFYDNKLFQTIEAVQNRTIQLSCEATGEPRPRFSWYRKDKEIFSGQESYSNLAIIRGEQVLQISNIQEYDADLYSCAVSNGGKTIEKKFKVIVVLPPRIMKRTLGLETHRIMENTPITFHCKIYNYNSTRPKISWKKDNSPILLTDTSYYLTHNNGQSLTVLNPTVSEAGRYSCTAENIAGRDLHTFVLAVTSAPKFPSNFNRFKEKLSVQLGSLVNFQCPAEGVPPPKIVWFNKNVPISPYEMINFVVSNNGKLLTIPAVNKESGTFKCVASNVAGRISKAYELEIFMPPLVRLDKVEVQEREGSTFSILCTAEGYPKPIIQWTRDGKGLFRLGTKADPKTGILTISSANEEDSGRYTCTATNKVNADSKSVDVTITSPPKITTSRTPITVQQWEQVMLPCKVEGSRPIKVHWFTPSSIRLARTIVGEYRLLPDQGLIIERVRKDHAGVYRCVANNDAGYQDARIKLEVLVPPKIFRPENLETTGILNSVLQINCKVIEGMPSPKIVWERNGVTLSKFKNYYTTTEAGLFIFNSLKNDDEGSLTCIAKNSAGEDRLTFQINVEILPKVTLPMSITGDEGESVTIKCKVEGKPRPKITWKKEGRSLSAALETRFRLNADNEVYIFNLKPEDAGNYNCIAEREGTESATSSTYLSIFTKPKFVNTPKDSNTAQEGRWVIFRCEANSHPKPDIKWMFNGRMIAGRKPYNGRGSLVLGPLKSDNSGEYRCIAKNRVGTTVHRFMLDVLGKPKVMVYQSDAPVSGKNSRITTLVCKTEGKVDSVVWLKNGIPVENSTRMVIMKKNLVIKDTVFNDTGTYQCIATNTAGEAQGKVKLLVKSAPKIVLHPLNTSTTLGDILILHCAAEGYPGPSISWFRNGLPVVLDYSHSLIRNGSLRIIGAQKEHEGFYFCRATNMIGDENSNVSYVSIQIPGGWSGWTEWSSCSVSCGRGTMSRLRKCDNPPPSSDGQPCIGLDKEEASCLVRFCPVNGAWSNWSPWSRCSSTCGSGMIQRTRRCDSPPASNLGQSCKGKSMEEMLCEQNPPCPINGIWSYWSAWTPCSVTCGRGGSQRRERFCNSPAPKNGGKTCDNKGIEVRACTRTSCPVDGDWSVWSKWSFCSKSCNSGMKQRTRICNNPSPQFGGSDCFGESDQTDTCNASPCPVHGQWSNWASWSECSVPCGKGGNGIQERGRTCTEPAPSRNGRWCRGSGKEVRSCNVDHDACSKVTKWDSWSDWGECSITCSNTGSGGFQSRVRFCRPGNKCEGKKSQTKTCNGLPSCSINIGGSFNSLGEIRGKLDNKDVGVILINGTWNSKGIKKTDFKFNFTKIKPDHKQCMKILSGVLTPILWHYAYEVAEASNGKRLTKGNFLIETLIEFADSRSITFKHNFFTRKNQPKLLVEVDGQCPLSIENNKNSDITLSRYKEIIVQMNPSLGKLNFDAARVFRVNGYIEPYQWTSNVTVPKHSKQKYIIQQLVVENIKIEEKPKTLQISLSALIAENDEYNECPKGFQLVEGTKYCEDVNECRDNSLNKCGQICENTVPRFKCHCRPGYSLGLNGHSCTDIDECALSLLRIGGSVAGEMLCNASRAEECVNTPGSYRCVQKCSVGFQRFVSNGLLSNCEDINECLNPFTCGEHKCVNTHGSYYCDCKRGYQLQKKTCLDIDECHANSHSCSPNQKCVNTNGSYICETVCKVGFRQSNETGKCEDIDECALGLATCSYGARCQNLPGSYSCRCDSGLVHVGGACVDIDECKVSSHLCTHGCRNTFGSYECICPSNMKPAADKKSCIDSKSLCRPGFQWLANDGCVDVDECSINVTSSNPPCQYKCVNTYGSYWCRCPPGYNVAVDKRKPASRTFSKCSDVDECKLNSYICPKDKLCINSPGSYSCINPECPKGFQYHKKHMSCVKCLPNSNIKFGDCEMVPGSQMVRFINVQMPGIGARAVEVRVINTASQKERNCEYSRLKPEAASSLPVHYTTGNGSIILQPKWSTFNADIYHKQPYSLYFNVSCWSTPQKVSHIFQNSFYIYITVSKYPF